MTSKEQSNQTAGFWELSKIEYRDPRVTEEDTIIEITRQKEHLSKKWGIGNAWAVVSGYSVVCWVIGAHGNHADTWVQFSTDFWHLGSYNVDRPDPRQK